MEEQEAGEELYAVLPSITFLNSQELRWGPRTSQFTWRGGAHAAPPLIEELLAVCDYWEKSSHLSSGVCQLWAAHARFMAQHPCVCIRLDWFLKRTEEHEGWEGDRFAWGWGSLSAVGGRSWGWIWSKYIVCVGRCCQIWSSQLCHLLLIPWRDCLTLVASKPQSLPQEHWG